MDVDCDFSRLLPVRPPLRSVGPPPPRFELVLGDPELLLRRQRMGTPLPVGHRWRNCPGSGRNPTPYTTVRKGLKTAGISTAGMKVFQKGSIPRVAPATSDPPATTSSSPSCLASVLEAAHLFPRCLDRATMVGPCRPRGVHRPAAFQHDDQPWWQK